MRQAITTKYLGPTDHKGSRVLAKAQAGRVTIPWDHALGMEANHVRAAMALARKYGWYGTWTGGALPDGGYVFCQAVDYTTVRCEPEGKEG